MTVSRVINGAATVRESTRRRVNAAIQANVVLDYALVRRQSDAAPRPRPQRNVARDTG